MEFVAFPTKNNAIFANEMKKNTDIVETHVSGSLGLYYSGKCHKTYPNQTLFSDEKQDWCSNIGKSKEAKPWITYNLKGKSMKISGYSIRSGCCWYTCCCVDDDTMVDGYCCCRLYSFSLQGSNDNKTWKTIHKVEKDNNFWECKANTYELKNNNEQFMFLRILLDEQLPGCKFCMQINQIEFYGDVIDSQFAGSFESDDNDESVSIIGKVDRSMD